MVKYDTKSLTAKLGEINAQGWIEEHRKGNQGSAGNTLEDLLGVKENNLKLPDAGEWELKTHKYGSSALLTLFHSEPKLRNTSLVERYLVPKFGWPRKSGKGLSFRQTLTAQKYTNRGFKIDTSEDDMLKLNSQLSKHEVKTNPLLGTSKSLTNIEDNSFDLLITSPPYGDSKTTVAYGQFSRTSLQWLNLDVEPADEVPKLDRKLLGGKVNKDNTTVLPSNTLNQTLNKIKEQDEHRAREIKQFYADLYDVLKECKRVMKPNSYQFWVTANRTVKGVQIPTDKIITELFESINISKLVSYTRNIPNKRMPTRNSPTNKKGKTNSTMKQEHIVLYR